MSQDQAAHWVFLTIKFDLLGGNPVKTLLLAATALVTFVVVLSAGAAPTAVKVQLTQDQPPLARH